MTKTTARTTTLQTGAAFWRARSSWGVLVSALVSAGSLLPAGVAGAVQPGSADATKSASDTAALAPSYGQLKALPTGGSLSVVLSSPKGRVKAGDNPVFRWLFDRPVAALASVDEQLDPKPFVTIVPPIAGSFRWASTRTLLFEPAKPLPLATSFSATVQGLKALDGTVLASPDVTTFETARPQCSLVDLGLNANASGGSGASTGATPSYVRVTCSQNVSGRTIAESTTIEFRPVAVSVARYEPRADELSAMQTKDPAATKAFLTRLAAMDSRTKSTTAVTFVREERCSSGDPKSDVCTVLQLTSPMPKDTRVWIEFGAGLVGSEGPLPSLGRAERGAPTPRTPFLVTRGCRVACDPENVRPVELVGITASGKALVDFVSVKNLKTGVVTKYEGPIDAESDPTDTVLSLTWAKFAPNTSYEITVAADAPALGGGTLGYDAIRLISFGPRSSFTEVPGGEVVLEAGVTAVRAKIRNVTELDVVSRQVARDQIVATVRSFAGASGAPEFSVGRVSSTVTVKTPLDADAVQSIRLGGTQIGNETTRSSTRSSTKSTTKSTATPTAGSTNRGVFVVAVRPRSIVPGSRYNGFGVPYKGLGSSADRSRGGPTGWQPMIVQRTDLAVTLKSSRSNVLVAVASLATGAPIQGAKVSLHADGRAYWTGVTDADGVVLAKPHPDRGCGSCDLVAIVEATKNKVDDVAYAQTRWREWGDEYSYKVDESELTPQERTDRRERLALDAKLTPGSSLIDSVFTDRGVYRLGEQVKVKGVVRMQELQALRALPKSVNELPLTVEDPRGVRVFSRAVKISANGSFDTSFTVPEGGSQGSYSLSTPGGYASFLVTSFRRPDFVVEVKAGESAIRGDALSAKASSRYLFGAPLANGIVQWTVNVSDTYVTPPVKVKGIDPSAFSWDFQCFYDPNKPCAPDSPTELDRPDYPDTLNAAGEGVANGALGIQRTRHRPLQVTFEAEVSDVSRQAFAARDSTFVYPGEFSLGVRRTGSFPVAGKPFTAEVLAADTAGKLVGGVAAKALLVRWDWASVDRVSTTGDSVADGGWKAIVVDTAAITTSGNGVAPVTFTPEAPGTYEIRVSGSDARGNYLEAGLVDYVVGPGEVAWERTDSPNVQLVADKETYAPGETAQILIKSPWAKASGLLTLERNGVLESRRFAVTGSATVVTVPITTELAPNVYASVLLTKGRTEAASAKTGDRGRPGVLSGSVNLVIPPKAKTLNVSVTANQAEYLPGADGTATVKVRSADGKPASGEVTVWAVDEGVLRLTNYTTPDPLATFYAQRSLDVDTSDSRMRLARGGADEFADKAKGDEAPAYASAPGGGGGADDTGTGVRSDFRILAAWSASVAVDDTGEASVQLKLPQSLTAYRLIAVAASGADRFGSADSQLRISTPFQVRPALPRFVALGDEFEAGAVVQNLTKTTGPATLSIVLPADSPLTLVGPGTITIAALGTAPTEVRFKLKATRLGSSSFTMKGVFGDGSVAGSTDQVAASIPVLLTQRLDTVAASGEVDATAAGASAPAESIRVPKGAIAGIGGLKLSVSSSNLAGLAQSVDSLVEYPYGCLEQRSSRLKVILGLASLEGRYELPGLAPAKLKALVQKELNRIADYRASDGGLSYWPGGEISDVFLSAKVLDLLLDARAAKFGVPVGMIDQLSAYLGEQVRGLTTGETNEEAADISSARGTVASALAHAGKPERSLMTTLVNEATDNDNLPYTERVALLDALLASGETGSVPQGMYADVLASVRLDGDEASVEAPEDWYGSFFSYRGSGSVVATADLLSLVMHIDPKHPLISPLSRWLLNKRINGTWGDTYTNGSVLHAFTDVATIAEKVRPEISASLTAGAATLTEKLGPTSLDVLSSQSPLSAVGSAQTPLVVTAKGQGTLHWAAELRYATPAEALKARSQGFSVERSYFPYKGAKSILGMPKTTFAAGDLVTVELLVTSADRRSNVVVDDPLPAGFEALDATLASTATGSTDGTDAGGSTTLGDFPDGIRPAEYAGIDHTETRDDRVLLFATQLEPGTFRYTYTARATAPGRFVAAPTQAQEMYRLNVYGRSGPVVVTVTPPSVR